MRKLFTLPKKFVDGYKLKPQRFGFGILGELAYLNSYSRITEQNRKEIWPETVERVVNGTFNMLCEHLEQNNIRSFSTDELQQLACNMYDHIFHFKFLPPGRGLWAMGTRVIEERKLYSALNNCAFVSTKLRKDRDISRPFEFTLDMLMMGTGVGFDTKLASDLITIQRPANISGPLHKIEDSREGYVRSLKVLLDSYFFGHPEVQFDYSGIRKKGEKIKCFGGNAAGSGPLKILHESLRKLLNSRIDSELNSRDILDIMNLIGRSVIVSNVRRSSLVAFGDLDADDDFVSFKDYKKYPERAEYGWTSNNSVYAQLGMDYSQISSEIKHNGEPGLIWLENMRNYGRMIEPPNFKDYRAEGGNPCLEQTLESFELCCLVEVFPFYHDTLQDFKETLELALLYAKIVTLGLPHWPESAEIVQRNRRIGCSLSGIAEFVDRRSLHSLYEYCTAGYRTLQEYDAYLSKVLKVPRSIKLTSIKPSGTVSLLAGTTSGIHYPDFRNSLRRIRIPGESPLLPRIHKLGYNIESDIVDSGTAIVEIPLQYPKIRTIPEIGMWEQLNLASFMQRYWADNQVSCTIKVGEDDDIPRALDYFQYQLKGVSFLPYEKKIYQQAPIEQISEEEYTRIKSQIQPHESLCTSNVSDSTAEAFCDSDRCHLS